MKIKLEYGTDGVTVNIPTNIRYFLYLIIAGLKFESKFV